MIARTSSLATVLASLVVGLGACGGQSRSPTPAAASDAAAGASMTATRPGSTTPTSARTNSNAGAATTTTAPPPPQAGTAPAPDGLRSATGYGSNDNCMSGCSGTVPASLRRALHLPSASAGGCPISGGGGPVTPSPAGTLNASGYVGSAWSGARVTWSAASSYDGPILIRGRQLDGPHAVGFGVGHVPYDELQLPAGGPRQWQTVTRVRGPGCFGYQVDGAGFSTIFVFRVP
jgi:hypothetical protein